MSGAFWAHYHYSPEDDKVVMRTYRHRRPDEIASLLGRTPRSVRERARRIGAAPRAPAKWSEKEDEILTALWYKVRVRHLTKHLPGRSRSAIKNRRLMIGLGPQREANDGS